MLVVMRGYCTAFSTLRKKRTNGSLNYTFDYYLLLLLSILIEFVRNGEAGGCGSGESGFTLGTRRYKITYTNALPEVKLHYKSNLIIRATVSTSISDKSEDC